MKAIGDYWERLKNDGTGKMVSSGIEGHYEYDVEFSVEWFDPSIGDTVYLYTRKTFKSALNDAKRYLKKTGRECDIYATWIEYEINDTEGGKVEREYNDCAMLGTIMNGEWFDLCEPIPFEIK